MIPPSPRELGIKVPPTGRVSANSQPSSTFSPNARQRRRQRLLQPSPTGDQGVLLLSSTMGAVLQQVVLLLSEFSIWSRVLILCPLWRTQETGVVPHLWGTTNEFRSLSRRPNDKVLQPVSEVLLVLVLSISTLYLF